jgi:pyridoxal phosphate enzyme (YggS family)
MTAIGDRLREIEARIAVAARAAGRAPKEVTLVGVTKKVAAAQAREAVAAGLTVLGENYAQELRDKAKEVVGARWHFIGPLQRNKVKYVVGVAELIHSVDSAELARAIAARAEAGGMVQRCLLQVDLAGETQKAGCVPAELPSLLRECRALPSLSIEGLMCLPPAAEDPRPHFSALAELARAHGLSQLSMGMSGDFEAAITEGATLVRVGTAIFGPR